MAESNILKAANIIYTGSTIINYNSVLMPNLQSVDGKRHETILKEMYEIGFSI